MLTVEFAPPERATAKLEIANEEGVVLARGKPAGKGSKPLAREPARRRRAASSSASSPAAARATPTIPTA